MKLTLTVAPSEKVGKIEGVRNTCCPVGKVSGTRKMATLANVMATLANVKQKQREPNKDKRRTDEQGKHENRPAENGEAKELQARWREKCTTHAKKCCSGVRHRGGETGSIQYNYAT